MDMRSSSARRGSLVCVPVALLVALLFLGACDTYTVWQPSQSSELAWKDIARRAGLATGVEASCDYTGNEDEWLESIEPWVPGGDGITGDDGAGR